MRGVEIAADQPGELGLLQVEVEAALHRQSADQVAQAGGGGDEDKAAARALAFAMSKLPAIALVINSPGGSVLAADASSL